MRPWARTLALLPFFLFSLNRPSLLAQPGGDSGAGRRFAIVIGIDQYFDSNLVSLQKAQNDAEDLGAALDRMGGYKAVSVMSGDLSPTDPLYPSKNKIIDRIQALSDIVRPEDQVLFFFSGHGVNDKSGDSYILPIDAQVKDPGSGGVVITATQRGRASYEEP
jgi:uncharacterized caspase-like protein